MGVTVKLLIAFLPLGLLAGLLAGCSGRSAGHPGHVSVSAKQGGSVALDGATLSVPPDAVSGQGSLAASTGGKPPSAVRPTGAGAPALTTAAAPVHFVLTGARVVRPVNITFRLRSFRLPSGLSSASQASAVWLAYYNTRTQQWQRVPSTYHPVTRTVTAQVQHLSWWAPWTWDWQQIALRLHRSLSALGSGRAAPSPCPGVHGVTVTSSGGQDPPLIGCATANGANALTVSLTGNRSYAMVVHAPAAPAAEAVFDLVTLGYARCILDSVARSEPASFADAPGLIVECFPVLAEASTLLRFYLKYLEPVSHYVQFLLEAYDRAHDASLGLSGKVYVDRPAAVITLACSAPGLAEGNSTLPFEVTGLSCAAGEQVLKSFFSVVGTTTVQWSPGVPWIETDGFSCQSPGVPIPGSAPQLQPGAPVVCTNGAEEIRFALPG